MNIEVREIPFESPEQKESIDLRYRVLRQPLRLNFEKEDLAKEYVDFHIAAFSGPRLIGILLLKPTRDKHIIKMRQVAVEPQWQGKGVGKEMVRFSENFAREKGFKKIELNARKTAVLFYLSLGYQIEGDQFMEVGIPHKKMCFMLRN